jgi:hypothetical protein
MRTIDKIIIAGVSMLSTTFGYFGGKYQATQLKNVPTYYVDSTHADGFADFVNAGFRADRSVFPCLIDKPNFKKFMKNIHELKEDSITLPEFVCLFFTVYNETGGSFKTLSERGNDQYFFERRKLHNGNWKASYNKIAGNQSAGNYLKSVGIKADYDAWNGQDIYPYHEPEATREAARNADFYKFRGQGFIQITGRHNFNRCVLPELPELHMISYKTLDSLFQNDYKFSLRCTRNYLRTNPAVWAKINKDNPDWNAYGHLISGTATYHNFANRADRLYRAILNEGFENVFK